MTRERASEKLLRALVAEAAEHPDPCPHGLSPHNRARALRELEEEGYVTIDRDGYHARLTPAGERHGIALLPPTIKPKEA